MRPRIKLLAQAIKGPHGSPITPRQDYSAHFYKGNQHACAKNLTEDANRRRIQAMFRAFAVKERMKRGEVIMTEGAKKARRDRKRLRLKETLILEARQVQEIARKTAPAVMEMLKEVIKNVSGIERTSDRIAAASVILERAYGKANQTNTNVNVDANGKAAEVSSKELTTRIEETLRAIEGLTGRVVKEEPSKERPVDIRKCDGDPGSSTLH